LTARQRVVAVIGVALVAFLYVSRLGAGSVLLPEDDEQCTKWPTYETTACFEMIPLDEVHYVPDARDVVRFGTESTTDVPPGDDGAFIVHPPVGKWLIAAGIALVGDEPLGWRLFNSLAGVLGVALAFSLARRLMGSVTWAFVAAGLLALDGLWFTMSRVAMLDIAAGVTTLAATRATIEVLARIVERRPRATMRIVAGAFWGLALASKWSTAPYALVAGVLLLAAELNAWRIARRPAVAEPIEVHVFGRDAIEAWADALVTRTARPRPTGGMRATVAAVASMSLVPALVYVATFTPWFVDDHRYLPPRCEDRAVAAGWLCYQQEQLDFHRNLEKYEAADTDDEATPTGTGSGTASATGETIIPVETGPPETPIASSTPAHPYFGHGISWAWIGRPVVHAYHSVPIDGVDHAIEVMSVPNPISWWWAFFFALPWLVVAAARDRSARLVLAMIAAGWVPYLIADVIARPVFLFYATPLVPFLAIGSSMLCKRLWEGPAFGSPSSIARGVTVGVLVATVAAFAWLYPIHAGVALPLDDLGWHARIWFGTDCTADTIKVMCWI
jgi:dolichyl-phosphate-mannose--protein O-mannosyl transferase